MESRSTEMKAVKTSLIVHVLIFLYKLGDVQMRFAELISCNCPLNQKCVHHGQVCKNGASISWVKDCEKDRDLGQTHKENILLLCIRWIFFQQGFEADGGKMMGNIVSQLQLIFHALSKPLLLEQPNPKRL